MESPHLAPPSSRLSLKHGASLEAICAYMTRVAASLRQTQILKVEDTWQPSTPLVGDHYLFIREIGRGHFGVVRLCEEKASRHLYACKSILKSSIQKEEDVTELCSEVVSVLRLQHKLGAHQNIVQLHEVLEDADSLHLILDYCGGGDLFDFVSRQKRLTERDSAGILKQLIVAVRSMHACGVVHRDLKPENILMSRPKGAQGAGFAQRRPEVKVADFGLCVILKPGQTARGVAGSPFYMAPEVIRGKAYGAEVDTWSLGIILYTCLAGSLPFWGKGHEAVFSAVLKGRLDFVKKPWPVVSPEAKHLIRCMLNADPARRISMEQVLAHPWMQQHCPELKRAPQRHSHVDARPQPLSHQSEQPLPAYQQPRVRSGSGQSQVQGAWASRYVVSPLASMLATQDAANLAGQAVATGRPQASSPPADGKENMQGSVMEAAAERPAEAYQARAQAVVSPKTSPSVEEGKEEGAWKAGSKRQPVQASQSPMAKRPLSPSPFSRSIFSPPSQRPRSPSRVLQLASHRVQHQLSGTSKGAEEAPQRQWQDLHMIPSPPRDFWADKSGASSPLLLHKVQAALSMAHPFPRLYLPSTGSNDTPGVSPFQSPMGTIFSDYPQERFLGALKLASLLPSASRDVGAVGQLGSSSFVSAAEEMPFLSLAIAEGIAEDGIAQDREDFKKLTVDISSPTCLTPAESCQTSPERAVEVVESLRMEDVELGSSGGDSGSPKTPPHVAADKLSRLVEASPFSLADNLVASLFSPARRGI